MKKLIQGKELKVLLIALIVVGLGIVVCGISAILIKNKSANKIVTNQDTSLNQSTVEISAVYLVPINGGQVTKQDLTNHPEILPVTDFEALSSHTKNWVAIWIDKDAVNLLPRGWLYEEPQKYYPIIMVGYNNALYSMREKLGMPITGPKVDWSKYQLEPGFSAWMIKTDEPDSISAFMKGYTETVTAERILDVSDDLLKKSLSIIEYRNTQYGFSFSLPESWKGYSIVEDKWEGSALGGDVTVEQGPIILIRHPQWTLANPRQDIPIMIFSLNQWGSLQLGKFHIGAAPIGPKELGRNSKYVFALPARYNYAFPTGFEEVEQILENNPLDAF